MMRVLITGGCGFLGSHLADAFVTNGDEVFVLDGGSTHNVRHLLKHERFHHISHSVLDPDAVEEAVSKADLVYHLAAIVGVKRCLADPDRMLAVNLIGTHNVVTSACKYANRLVFASTSEVYGRNPKVPWREDDDRILGATTVDRWSYATSKAAGEHLCFAHRKRGLPVTVIRYFNAYGPRIDRLGEGRLLPILIGQLLRGADLTVVGDGSQSRCFTYVSDAIAATVQAGLRPEAEGKVINIGSDVETSVLEFAQTMLELYGAPRSRIRFITHDEAYGTGSEEILRRMPDIDRMQSLLHVRPTVSLRDGLARTLEWFSKLDRAHENRVSPTA